MKNLRKVLAFTLALAMLLSTMTATFAASKEVEALANLKLLLNTTDAEVNQELTRSVGLAMVLKALGYAQADADAKAADNKFVDMEKASWAKGYAALAEELKISNGTSVDPKLFSPLQKLDQKSFVTFMLRALGYDSDKAWAEAGALAKEAGLVAGELSTGTFSKGDAAVVMYNALLAKVQNDEKGRTLAQKLVDENKLSKELAVANGLLSAEPENLELASVKADNLREVVVMFNGSVEKETAEKAGNYKLRGKSVGQAKLMEDNKTVVLTLSEKTALENNKEVKLTVTGVKNIAGVVMKKAEMSFTPKDVEYPAVKNVVFTGPKSFDITFSEPIKKAGKVALKDGKSTLSARAEVSESDERVVNVTTFSTLKDGVEYVVAVGNPKDNNDYTTDYANYPNIYFEGTYQYNADKTAPEAKVTKAEQKVVAVEFTKPVKGLTKDHFYHSFAAYKAVALYKDADLKKPLSDKNEAVSKVWVEFYNKKGHNPLPAGKVQFTILGETNKVKIQDNWGNAFASTTYDLEIVADREAPEVVTAEVTGEKEIKVTFNEKISNLHRDRFTLLDKDGKEVEKGSKMKVSAEDNDKVAKLMLSESYAGKTLTLQVKGVKDASLYENMMADYTTSLDFTDKTWKGLKSAEFKRTGDKEENYRFFVYVSFEEGMDESATDVANYKFYNGSKAVNVKGSADFFEGQNSIVQIELSYDKDKNDGSTDASFVAGNTAVAKDNMQLLVNNSVKDLAGNNSSNFQNTVAIETFDANKNAPKVDKVEAVETKKVVVKFDKELVSLETKNFGLTGGHGKDASFNFVDGKTLEIYLADDHALNTGDFDVNLTFTPSKETVDVFGRWLQLPAGKEKVADKIAPAVAAVKYSSTASGESAEMAWLDGASRNSNFDNAPLVYASAVVGAEVNDEKPVTATFQVAYTESLDKFTLSTTTFTLSDGYKIESTPEFKVVQVNGKNRNVVEFVAKKNVKKDVTNQAVVEALNDVTVTQQGTIKDAKGNSLAGNSNALKVLFAK